LLHRNRDFSHNINKERPAVKETIEAEAILEERVHTRDKVNEATHAM